MKNKLAILLFTFVFAFGAFIGVDSPSRAAASEAPIVAQAMDYYESSIENVEVTNSYEYKRTYEETQTIIECALNEIVIVGIPKQIKHAAKVKIPSVEESEPKLSMPSQMVIEPLPIQLLDVVSNVEDIVSSAALSIR